MGDVAFDDLRFVESLGLHCSWDVLDHDLGTLARIGPEQVAAAARLVRTGDVFALNLPLTEPDPPLFRRDPLRHTIFALDRNNLDDRLDSFHPQGSSQWDGLRHVRAREHGYFGGYTEDFTPGAGPLGIEHWAARGIVGRGVLLDVGHHRELLGDPLDAFAGDMIGAAELQEVADAQGVALVHGDIVLVRLGWVTAYRRLDGPDREEIAQRPRASGLRADEAVARWLWDSGAAALGIDNPTVEPIPGDAAIGSLHRRLIPMLGFALAELLDLDALAQACADDGRWDFQFVAVPLGVPGGVGSPSNAVAIR
ncbi:cyclase family protein [Baekduia soli]|uniref:Cyclase family protein n=1 Tax=Baekduia soli TaxID=496014 RepID=A0A5B8U0G0_9ACTN|nr:cyclase family protein [Baekduia soli]QEC46499.1 cyclase family protein [Baekduia soli]